LPSTSDEAPSGTGALACHLDEGDIPARRIHLGLPVQYCTGFQRSSFGCCRSARRTRVWVVAMWTLCRRAVVTTHHGALTLW
jgi:hypothetical protein